MIKNIYPFYGLIDSLERHRLNRHGSALIWLTGLSGSGKSTLAHAVEARLHGMGIHSYVLDGDNIRTGLNSDLGLSPKDRKENIRRVGEVAKIMVDAGLIIFAAFIAPYRESRQYVRELMQGFPYYECYIKCDIRICEQRDPKDLYRRARAGEIKNLTGHSAPYEEPLKPDLIIETDKNSKENCVDSIINFLSQLKIIMI